MKHIKFMAWDHNMKEFIDPELVSIQLTKNGLEGARYYNKYFSTPSRIELFEFTGLIDTSGKEWCEGDIIKTKYDDDDSMAVIVFESGAFRKHYVGWPKEDPKPLIEKLDLDMFRVIGHKRTHPELLK